MSASPLPEARDHDRAVSHSSSRYAGWTAGQRRAERQRLLDAALERARREAAAAGLTMVCEECLGEGFVTLLEIIPADDTTCPPRWDDWTQPDWDALDDKLPCKVLCTCILAPQFVNYIEVAA